MTLTPVAERLAVELSIPVFTTGMSRLGFENPNLPHTEVSSCFTERYSSHKVPCKTISL